MSRVGILRIVSVTISIGAAVAQNFHHGLLGAQFTNRYPKVDGYRHHIYLEDYELPALNVGPSDPAPSPDGRSVAVAARGWLWLMDLASGEARRLTRGGDLDARPAW